MVSEAPVVGGLFRQTGTVVNKRELVIMLKPQVVGGQTWQQEIERSRTLLDKWYPEQR